MRSAAATASRRSTSSSTGRSRWSPRDLTFEVDERVNAAGDVLIAARRSARSNALAGELARAGVEAVAVCFLHSYANPAHERLVGEILRRVDPSTVRHAVARDPARISRIRAHLDDGAQRLSSARACATISARWRAYLRRENFAGKVHIMRSNGGVMSIAQAQDAAGLDDGIRPGRRHDRRRPAGRASRPRALHRLRHGRHHRQVEPHHRRHAGHRGRLRHRRSGAAASRCSCRSSTSSRSAPAAARSPGSTQTGGLHVGPKSAGADPGPACYGKGSDDPVVTDADLVLGRINPERFLNGGMKLDVAAAREARASKKIGKPLGLSTVGGGARHRDHRRHRHVARRCARSRSTRASIRATPR